MAGTMNPWGARRCFLIQAWFHQSVMALWVALCRIRVGDWAAGLRSWSSGKCLGTIAAGWLLIPRTDKKRLELRSSCFSACRRNPKVELK